MNEIMKAKLLLEGYRFGPLERHDDDDIYKMEDWIRAVEVGSFTNYDGMGIYALEGEKVIGFPSSPTFSDIFIYPSDLKKGKIDKRFTHIVWYNK